MKIKFLAVFAAALLFCLAADSNALAQGKGGGNKGGGGGKPANAGQSGSHGNSGNSGQSGDHGNSGNNGKKSDSDSTDVDSDGHGKPDKTAKNIEKAREKAARMTDKDLNRYKGLSKKLGTTPEEMRARYQAALLHNPDLTYGNFVSAHMVADNLGDRYPGVTSGALLDRMARGRSLGQAMQDLKVAPAQITSVQSAINDRLKNVLH